MTSKAGQKCTAIRRAFVPKAALETVQQQLIEQLKKVVVGDPSRAEVTMGALASKNSSKTLQLVLKYWLKKRKLCLEVTCVMIV